MGYSIIGKNKETRKNLLRIDKNYHYYKGNIDEEIIALIM